MIARVALLGLLVAGCAQTPTVATAGPCRAEPVQDLVGRSASERLFADAMRRSGARQVRRITPDASVTMDYRTDRLNVTTDAADMVTAIRCG